MDKETALDKIKKCLNLAQSGNEHEAASALRQAQKLMEIYRVSSVEVSAAGVSESDAKAGAIAKPAAWENRLAATIADAFSCELIFVTGMGQWRFIGVGPQPEIAQYAFLVLAKQLRKQRQTFVRSECKRLVPASKTRRADLFCDAWVRAIAAKAQALAGQAQDEQAIAAYKLLHYPSLSKLATQDRNAQRNLRMKDWDAVSAGAAAGRRAQLNHAVTGGTEKKMLNHADQGGV